MSDSFIDSPWIGNRVKEPERTIQSRLDQMSAHDSFWWSATDGGAVIVDSAPSREQAIANIADDFRLGAVERLRLAKCHAIEVDGWRIALQKPEESSDDFLCRSCGQKERAARPQQQIDFTPARP